MWNFFTQLKIYIFPIYYSILNKKKTFYIFRKKNRARCFDIREKIVFNNRYFKKKFYSKLHNKVGKIKKNFFMKSNNLFKFFVKFFYSIKNIYFPIYYRILNKKKTFYIFRKKNPASMLRYSRKIFVQQSLFKIFFYSKLRNMSGKLKKKFFMKPNNLFKFFVNFFTQLKIYIFPIYYSILNKKKTFYIFRKKNRAPCFDIREKILFNNRYFKKKFYSKLHNKVGKLKKKFFMKPNNLFKFFVKFFYSIKNIYFPDILPHFKQTKKLSIYFEKKIQPRCFDIREKFLFNNRYLKFFFILNCVICREKLKKKFSWSRITYLNFLWNFFTQLKIYIFPIYYSILNKKKTFYIFRKKNPASMLRYSRKIFVQ